MSKGIRVFLCHKEREYGFSPDSEDERGIVWR
jgi:hypothetical protein